jgi:hypothetical protein
MRTAPAIATSPAVLGPLLQAARIAVLLLFCEFSGNGLAATAWGRLMTDQFLEIPQDQDFHILLRVISCCTLGLWAFATGLLIGVFLFS